ncbi:ferritin-like metal-binding protein YciE [Saccharomonospora amisosensis]|uniref:Ferritin-like metal-binding protein YciE n=1 Tax=Saccharomonospora amisosensis TaxID=1128677 RepID=A0A7X5ULI7_9PSEU|nr:DUF892 family protein [Saccharomonospora amisosensis]NIJ10232.1 ferritin-like metal-binding protein YciE [Saccharomonospora amisosensis]
MTSRDKVITWLNDAYAMEQALEETLLAHAKDAKADPEVRDRIEQHIEETRSQARTVKECIEDLGGTVSGTKAAFANMFGAIQGVANKPMGDTMVKNALADYAAEHFEIASYRALIDATRELGEDEITRKLTEILRQEEDMARFLETKLPGAVHEAMAAA